MRRNNRKSNISETIVYLLKLLTIVPFLLFFFLTMVGSACLLLYFLIRLLVQHYNFTLFGIIICLMLFHCIYCIKKIRQNPTDGQQATRGTGHKAFLTLHCVLDVICIVFFITLTPAMLSFPTKTPPQESPEPHTISESLTEPESGMQLSCTVYISKRGHKIHLNSDCSGMMYYFEMTYEEACEAGYSHCSRCFD